MGQGARLTLVAFVFTLAVCAPLASYASLWVELADNRGCARVDIRIEPSNRLTVRGSVVRPNSRAARGVNVVLYSAEPSTNGEVVASAVSDRRGAFSISAAGGRRYLLVGSVGAERGEVGPFELTPATAPILIVLRPQKSRP